MLAILPAAAPLSGQALAPVGAQAPRDTARGVAPTTDPNFVVRFLPSAGIGAAFAALGILLGGPATAACDQCTNVWVTPAGIGAIVGGTIGSAIGAARPLGRQLCTESERLQRGFAGAALGMLAGVALGQTEPLLYAFVATTPIGAVAFLRKC
jgi:hypothetical protein